MGLKRFTQSITMILVGTIVILTPLALGAIFNVTGLRRLTDGLWEVYLIWFWVVLVLSRWIFAAGWGATDYYLVRWLHGKGWFWFKPPKPERYHTREEPSVDKTGEILFYMMVVVVFGFFAFIFAEVAIRVASRTEPFYLS